MLKSIKLAILPLSLFIIHCSLFIALSSCSHSTQTNTGSLIGTVNLNNDTGTSALDPVDYAGVTVALYSLAALDPVIVGLNSSHPNIGVQISQETEFDHRLQAPVKTATTDADGSFSISNITKGKYNLVIMKEGWGVRYLYDIDIAEGDNTLNQKNSSSFIVNYSLKRSAIELFPLTELSGFVNNAFEFKTNHSYFLSDHVNFSSDVIMSPIAYIWVAAGKTMSFNALLTTPSSASDFARVTSADGMYGITQSGTAEIGKFHSIVCSQFASLAQNQLSSVITTFTETGWKLEQSNLTVNNMVLRYMRTGMLIEHADSVLVDKCNIQQSSDLENGGISYIDCTTVRNSNLIVTNCKVGIRQHTTSNASIINCYFGDNSSRGIYNLYETTCTVLNCSFINSDIAIETSGQSSTSIENCDITARIGIYNSRLLNWEPTYFTANNNNIVGTDFGAKTNAAYGIGNLVHLDATNNYWGTTQINDINELIWDRYDEDPNDPNYPSLLGIIDYQPILYSRIQNAGIGTD